MFFACVLLFTLLLGGHPVCSASSTETQAFDVSVYKGSDYSLVASFEVKLSKPKDFDKFCKDLQGEIISKLGMSENAVIDKIYGENDEPINTESFPYMVRDMERKTIGLKVSSKPSVLHVEFRFSKHASLGSPFDGPFKASWQDTSDLNPLYGASLLDFFLKSAMENSLTNKFLDHLKPAFLSPTPLMHVKFILLPPGRAPIFIKKPGKMVKRIYEKYGGFCKFGQSLLVNVQMYYKHRTTLAQVALNNYKRYQDKFESKQMITISPVLQALDGVALPTEISSSVPLLTDWAGTVLAFVKRQFVGKHIIQIYTDPDGKFPIDRDMCLFVLVSELEITTIYYWSKEVESPNAFIDVVFDGRWPSQRISVPKISRLGLYKSPDPSIMFQNITLRELYNASLWFPFNKMSFLLDVDSMQAYSFGLTHVFTYSNTAKLSDFIEQHALGPHPKLLGKTSARHLLVNIHTFSAKREKAALFALTAILGLLLLVLIGTVKQYAIRSAWGRRWPISKMRMDEDEIVASAELEERVDDDRPDVNANENNNVEDFSSDVGFLNDNNDSDSGNENVNADGGEGNQDR